MSSRVTSVSQAYSVLGLQPGAGFDAAKKRFRETVKHLHPDTTPPTPETLSRLADIVAAIRFLEAERPVCLAVEITPSEAKRGVTRTLKAGERPVIVRIPAGTRDGDAVSVVGDDAITVMIAIGETDETAPAPETPFPTEALDNFMAEFSRPSPLTRMTRWVRKSQSAA